MTIVVLYLIGWLFTLAWMIWRFDSPESKRPAWIAGWVWFLMVTIMLIAICSVWPVMIGLRVGLVLWHAMGHPGQEKLMAAMVTKGTDPKRCMGCGALQEDDLAKAFGPTMSFLAFVEADAELAERPLADDAVVCALNIAGGSTQLTIGNLRALRAVLPPPQEPS